MPQRRRPYSASHMRKTSRQVHDSTLGTHVSRRGTGATATRRPSQHRVPSYAQGVSRRAWIRRVIVALIAIAVVAGLGIGAGTLVFRGTVGGEFALRDSDASEALVTPRTGDVTYALATMEIGSVAVPLDNGGPDIIMLARLDAQNHTLALIDMPSSLQITSDNSTESIASIAAKGDAALIKAIASFAKIDIAHFVKIDKAGILGIVDALGGINVDVDQVIDDPRAGSTCIFPGQQALTGDTALTYLRATNLKNGVEDQLAHQIKFMTQLTAQLFSKDGNFATRLESIGKNFQTDYTLSDLEAIHSWLGGVDARGITATVAPGYFTAVTNVTGAEGERYVTTSSEMATLIDDLNNGREVGTDSLDQTSTVSPDSFVVDVQNGTTIVGAAATAADTLRSQGFSVGDVGNAEQPVFGETLVVYRDDDRGLARAKTVINALGVGRAVASSSYYEFAHDVLLIIGADNKPVS